MAGVFLYDGDCGFCTTSAKWLQRHAASKAKVEAWQYADLGPLGLTPDDCAEALMYVDDGRRMVGPEAVAAFLESGKPPWRTASHLLAAPASRHVAWPVYEWLNHHRDHLPGGRPATEGPRESTPVKGVRRRKPRDLAAAARLLRVVHADGQYPVVWPEAPRSWLDGDDVIDAWVVEQDGEMLGHVAICEVGRDPLSALKWREVTEREPSELAGISHFFVRPKAQGRGIGSALLDVAVAEIRARGLMPVLDVVSASKDAISLYERKGWRMIAMYPWGDKDSELWIYFYAAPKET